MEIGDVVVHNREGDLGVLTDVPVNGVGNYRVDYCQQSIDPDSEPRGGNGPVFYEGFPKPVTSPRDVLFAAGLKARKRRDGAKKALEEAHADLAAIKRAMALLSEDGT